jgi:hypothetical protein
MMKTATIYDLLSWKPCYSESQIRELAGDVIEFTALDVLMRDDIPADHRLWVVLRPELIDERTLRLFACDCAERVVLSIFEREYPDDLRPRQAIEVTRRYANGQATREELAAARNAAWSTWAATGGVAWAAAWGAAGDAARAAVGDAAWAAARAAARAAAGAAAWDVAWAAEHRRQVGRLIDALEQARQATPPVERARLRTNVGRFALEEGT